MFRKTVGLFILGLFVVSVGAFAEDHNALTKLGRGVTNALTGVVEIPKQVYLVSMEKEPVTGATYGTAKGICYGLLRTAAGVYDTVAFAIPPYDKPIMEPAFVFEGWKAEKESPADKEK
ncbi:MAG: exosortase system-associated protein, TIGR04073 family [Candidatus Omnitrophota bacterium]